MNRDKVPVQDAIYYSKFTEEIFEYLKLHCFPNEIRPSNYASLTVHLFDPINGNIGGCVYPSTISVYVGEIIAMFDEVDLYEINKPATDDCIKTIIAHVIIHELLHVNRVPDIIAYNASAKAHDDEELMIDRQSMLILLNIGEELNQKFKFKLRLDILASAIPGPYDCNGYEQTDIKNYFVSILSNAFQQVKHDALSKFFDKYQNVYLNIDIGDNLGFINIKSEGNYLRSSIGHFQQVMASALNGYSNFSYAVYTNGENENCGLLTVKITNRQRYPFVYKKQ